MRQPTIVCVTEPRVGRLYLAFTVMTCSTRRRPTPPRPGPPVTPGATHGLLFTLTRPPPFQVDDQDLRPTDPTLDLSEVGRSLSKHQYGASPKLKRREADGSAGPGMVPSRTPSPPASSSRKSSLSSLLFRRGDAASPDCGKENKDRGKAKERQQQQREHR